MTTFRQGMSWSELAAWSAEVRRRSRAWPSTRARAEQLSRYSEDEPRDEHGRWTGGGESGDDKPEGTPAERAAAIVGAVPGAAEKIQAAREKLAGGIPTDAPVEQGGFKTASGRYTPEREAVHDAILAKVFTPERIAAATPAPGEKPVAHLLGGSGGSGKSYFTGPNGTVDKGKAIYLNSDDFKAALPEYQGWNAALLHEESSDLHKTAEAVAQKNGLNVIVDGTMGNHDVMATRIGQYQAAGYRTEGHFMRVKPETSAKRAVERFMRGGETGRLVSPEMILKSTNLKNFEALRERLDASELYDNEGTAPTFVDRR